MGFAELKRSVGIESSGNMSFHLTKLRNLVAAGADGDYALTDDGREALWAIGNISGTRSGPSPEIRVRRTRKYGYRALIAVLIITTLAFGSVAVLQQEQLAAQQSQIATQQAQAALYSNQVPPFISGQSASTVLGQANFISHTSLVDDADVNPTANGLNYPTQTLFDLSGNLWVVDADANRVLEFKQPLSNGMSGSLALGQENLTIKVGGLNGAHHGVPTSGSLIGGGTYGPNGAAFDRAGNLWVADTDNNRIVEFVSPFRTGMAASMAIGQSNLTTNYGSTSRTGLFLPSSVAFDPSGNMWVLDSGNNRVLEFVPPFSTGMAASLVVGQENFASRATSTTKNGLSCFFGDIAVDPSGNLWVGDLQNNRVLEFKAPFTTGMAASVVIGQQNFTSNALSPSQSLGNQNIHIRHIGAENTGLGVAFDSEGDLWVSSNSRILEFRPPFSNGMQPSLEIGQPDFTSTAWVGGLGGLSVPGHPAFDSSGNLWIPDSGNNRVLEFASSHPASDGIVTGGDPSAGSLQYIEAAIMLVVAGAGGAYLLLLGRSERKTRQPGNLPNA
jgi:sugar lactone lactonase YvrE